MKLPLKIPLFRVSYFAVGVETTLAKKSGETKAPGRLLSISLAWQMGSVQGDPDSAVTLRHVLY